jgi:hypothetical protein
MDDKEDFVDESPQALDHEAAGASPPPPAPDVLPAPEAEATEAPPPALDPRKPGLYQLRPQGLRPPPRSVRKPLGRLRNDCPPDRRRPAARPSPKPRLR